MAVELEDRVDRLETIFGQFVAQTGAALLRMERGMEDFKNEMRVFKDEMGVFKDEMGAFKDEMGAFKDEMRVFKDEMQNEVKRSNKQWGEMARKMGTMVEDLVYPSLERIIQEMFGMETDELKIRIKRKLKDGQRREFDAIALAGEYVFLNSTKSTLKNSYVNDFVEEIKIFRIFFPEYAERKLIGILATLFINESVLKYAEKKGFLVLGVGEELMEVKNRKGFKPKEW
jgi:hypothetical protein